MDLSKSLGAGGGTSVQCLTLYIPNRDRDGREVPGQRSWVLRAAGLLAKIGGGVTIMPPVEGGWVREDGELIWENPVLVYTFIRPAEFRRHLKELRHFLHLLGRETIRERSQSSSIHSSIESPTSMKIENVMPRKRKSTTYAKVRDTGATLERISPKDLEEGLGATRVERPRRSAGSPYSVAAIRRQLAQELASTGGRPSRKEAVVARRIPLTQSEWTALDAVTEAVRSEGTRATAGQVAGVLLHQSLRAVAEANERLRKSSNATSMSTNEFEERVERILEAAANAAAGLKELKPVAEELLTRMREGHKE